MTALVFDTINLPVALASNVELHFSWTPAGTSTYTSSTGRTFTSPNATHGTALTFTATVTINGTDLSGPLTIVEYRWDFGDGVVAYGNPARHTYAMANFQAQTALRVTDSKGRQWFTRAQMYLT